MFINAMLENTAQFFSNEIGMNYVFKCNHVLHARNMYILQKVLETILYLLHATNNL